MSSEENTTSTGSAGRAQEGSQTRNVQQANPDAFLGRKQAPIDGKIRKINYKTALSSFFSRSLSAYQLLMSLCCGIKLQSWPEGTKGSRTEGQQQGRYHPKTKGKEAAKKCWEANWNIKQPTLVTDNISPNPGIMQAEPGPKYPGALVLAGPQHCGRWDPGYINTKEHLYNRCMAPACSHRHPVPLEHGR